MEGLLCQTPLGQEYHFTHVDLSQLNTWNGTMLCPVTEFLAQAWVTVVGLSLTQAGVQASTTM